jgi:quercetin dioxygenase-like cupin family protein
MPDAGAAPLQPKIVTPDQAKRINAFGFPMDIMLRAEETGGAFASMVVTIPHGEGPPPHFHHDHEEYFFVLEGEFEVTAGDKTATATQGSMMFVPRGTVHTFKCSSATPGKLLEWATPGGQERYFEAIDKLGADGALNPENIAAVSKAFETEFAGY